MARRIILIERDAALRNALAFSLELEGYAVKAAEGAQVVDLTGSAQTSDCLIISHEPHTTDLFETLAPLTSGSASVPIVVLATQPTGTLRSQVARIGAKLIEKPLIGDALSEALQSLFPAQEAA